MDDANRDIVPGGAEGALTGCIGAVFGACLIGSTVFSIAYCLLGESTIGLNDLLAVPFMFLLAFIGSLPIVGLSALVLGLPSSWVIANLKMEGPLIYSVGGFLLGLALLAENPGIDELGYGLWFSGGVYGGTFGFLWWHVYRRWCQ